MKMLINGEFIDKEDKQNILNPYNGEVVDTVPIANLGDANYAIESANNAKKSIQTMSAKEVSNALYNACLELESKSEEIAKLISLEVGKPYKHAIVEINRSVETLKLSAEEAKRIYGETVPLDVAGGANEKFYAFTKKIPLGVVGAITPFNFPVNLALHKIAPALAAKNTVIIKPPMEAPLSTLKIVEILNNYFPKGVVNAITGYGSEIGDALVTSPDVDKISFTGSVATGLFIASRGGAKKLTLELGGNDPLIVLEDANIEDAVNAAVSGAFSNSGQVCIGVKRIILDNKIADEFIDLFIKETKKLKLGDPLDKSTDIGPVIDENAALNIEESINNAIKDGADLLYGGKRNNCFIEPTILDNVNMSMDVVANETFGPVAPLIRVNGVDEAISIANDTKYGLQAGVFTNNLSNALKCAEEIVAGGVMINKASSFRADNMPFGGFKSSGIGKEGIKYAVEDMCKTKLIAFKHI
ncbi:MAG: lactaldehyde dehydrogenase [Methanobacteriaceae archaeon]|nr:lactaldehyde dehydrogenase [Methanobacteriaceae archaeon]